MMIHKPAAYFLLGCILFTAFWQLEIIWWCQWWGWGYSFGGLGDFGWQLYTWRDFWYAIIFAVFVALIWLGAHRRKEVK